ncbi:MAG: alpha/beta hydrolase [Treponema sp.]|nr:alpha/beta hydrolase [Treponema sp.]
MTTNTFYQTMQDGTEINVMRWIPDGDPKGVIQLSHGMSEHCLRYDKMGSILAENGWVLSAHDHRGHGKTAQKAEARGTGMFGYLADKDGFNKVEGDLLEVLLNLKADYPQKKCFLVGHSFGSIVAQNFMEKHGDEVDGVVLCGTTGPRQALMSAAKVVFALNALLLGKKHRSRLDANLAFFGYNKRVPRPKKAFSWLSKNDFNVQMYEADQWCGVVPTAEFFCEIVRGLHQVHKPEAMKSVPQKLPVYMIYGSEDPVGSYGKTIKKLIQAYKANGMTDVTEKIWQGDRHEIFNELDGEEVIDDMLKWIDDRAS